MGWEMPARGQASLTHYDLPLNFLASCGCAYGASYEPTAALSALAYSGAERASVGPGPGCGRCFRLTLQAPHMPDDTDEPPLTMPDPRPSVVVKIVDKCPSDQFCQASHQLPNKIGFQIHFDLALPSPALNLSFFPSDEGRFGYRDFGVWIIDYEAVSCEEWAGWSNRTNLGVEPSYPGYEDSCCPFNPSYTDQICPQSIKAPPPSSTYRSSANPHLPNPHSLLFLLLLSSLSWFEATLRLQ